MSEDEAAAFDAAVESYLAYVKTQAAELVPNTQEFVDAYKAGDFETAKALFPIARINYERIEPTAGQFGDLDPAIDYRKPGAEAEGLEFTGFHRIEMDLWLDAAIANYPGETIVALDEAGRAEVGDKLVADVTELYDEVHSADFELTVQDITNGAIGLLDEVAAPDGKLPGEENEFAHTDLYDFYANVEGAEVAYLHGPRHRPVEGRGWRGPRRGARHPVRGHEGAARHLRRLRHRLRVLRHRHAGRAQRARRTAQRAERAALDAHLHGARARSRASSDDRGRAVRIPRRSSGRLAPRAVRPRRRGRRRASRSGRAAPARRAR